MGIAAVLVAVLIVTGCDDCSERLVRGPAEGGSRGRRDRGPRARPVRGRSAAVFDIMMGKPGLSG